MLPNLVSSGDWRPALHRPRGVRRNACRFRAAARAAGARGRKGRGGNNGPTAAGKRGPNDTVTNVSRRPFTVRLSAGDAGRGIGRAARAGARLLGSLLARPRRPAASLPPRHRIIMSAKCRSVPGIHQRSAVGCSAESARQRHRPTMKLSSGEDKRGIRPGLSARR
jgi:hypothetical protein